MTKKNNSKKSKKNNPKKETTKLNKSVKSSITDNNKKENKKNSKTVLIQENLTQKNNNSKKTNIIILLNILIIILSTSSLIFNYLEKIDRIKKAEEEPQLDYKNENFVLLGDSITCFYNTEKFFGKDIPIVNSGISGHTTRDVLSELNSSVYKYNPTKVFLLIGINDLNTDGLDENIAYENIVRITKKIKLNRPNAQIYVESIYPVNIPNENDRRKNSTIMNINKKLEKYCDNNDITYIDIYSKLLDEDGNLSSEYTTDGIHISEKGYSKITNILLKYMEK